MRVTLVCMLVITFFGGLHAQHGTITGRVHSGGAPIQFASVGVSGTTKGAASDEGGKYEIQAVEFGEYLVTASAVGYEPRSKKVVVNAAQPIARLDLDLKESVSALDEVVISGTMKEVSKLESPVPVEVYAASFFRANPTPSVFESMQNVNGVRPQLNCNVCNTGDIHINGLEGPYTMVLIDGMPIVSGLSTVYGLTGIPQALIERVEIVKGPASTLYGSEAVGGLINIITKTPVNAPVFSTDVFATSWGEVNADIGVKTKAGEKAVSLLGLNYFNYQNPVDRNSDGFTDVTLQDRLSVFNKWSFKRKNDRRFSVAARYNYEERWGGEMEWTPEYRGGDELYGESIYTSRWEAFGLYDLPFSEKLTLQFSANGHNQNSVYGVIPYLADQYIGFGQLVWNKEAGLHDLLAGVAYRYTFYDDNTPATSEFGSGENKASVTHLPGLFLQDEITISGQSKLLLGMRYDFNSLHGAILSPRVNYKWSSLNKKNVVRLSAGNGYRVANVFTEDHAALTGARQVIFHGELEPETSWNANINLVKKILTGNNTYIDLDGTVWYTYFTNRIIPDYETNPNQIIYSNLDGYSVSKGVSLNADVAWNNGLKTIAGVTVMDVSLHEKNETIRQLLTERVTGTWTIGYNLSALQLSVDYTGNLYGPMRLPLLGALDNRPEYSSWYSIQNIQATKHLNGGWQLYGGVKNLLNFTPPAFSIARAFDPFDKDVVFDANGQVVPTDDNPNALTFDPSYVFAPNQGIRLFFGVRYSIN